MKKLVLAKTVANPMTAAVVTVNVITNLAGLVIIANLSTNQSYINQLCIASLRIAIPYTAYLKGNANISLSILLKNRLMIEL